MRASASSPRRQQGEQHERLASPPVPGPAQGQPAAGQAAAGTRRDPAGRPAGLRVAGRARPRRPAHSAEPAPRPDQGPAAAAHSDHHLPVRAPVRRRGRAAGRPGPRRHQHVRRDARLGPGRTAGRRRRGPWWHKPMTLLAVLAGLLIGLSLGALGGGGSILTVPALVYLLGQSPPQATTASLLVVGIAAVVGAAAHARAGRVRLRTGAIFGVLGIAGSYAGSRASAAVPADVLLAGFGLLMLAVAAVMIARRRGQGPARRAAAPTGGTRHTILAAAAATGVGLITGFFGVRGGFVLVLGFDMPTAAGTSLVVIAVNSAAALAARAGHGSLTLNWALVGAFTAAAVIGVLAGGRLARRASPQPLSAAFTALIVAVAGYTLTRSLPALL